VNIWIRSLKVRLSLFKPVSFFITSNLSYLGYLSILLPSRWNYGTSSTRIILSDLFRRNSDSFLSASTNLVRTYIAYLLLLCTPSQLNRLVRADLSSSFRPFNSFSSSVTSSRTAYSITAAGEDVSVDVWAYIDCTTRRLWPWCDLSKSKGVPLKWLTDCSREVLRISRCKWSNRYFWRAGALCGNFFGLSMRYARKLKWTELISVGSELYNEILYWRYYRSYFFWCKLITWILR
jgi:hypothetical protein